MKISEAGLALIKKYEGFSAREYPDPRGILTIGYGHRVLPGESFTVITQLEAEVMLEADVADTEKALTDLIEVDVSQNEFDALVSLAYNIGVGNFRGSTLLRLLNQGDYTLSAAQFSRWCYVKQNGQEVPSPGLLNRRHAEQDLFLHSA